MKQHITVEQLNELTDEQKDKLRNWWKPIEGDYYTDSLGEEWIYFECDDSFYSAIPDKRCLPLLSIGQCIELLQDKKQFKKRDGWAFVVEWNYTDYPEFIDALWQAVKEVL